MTLSGVLQERQERAALGCYANRFREIPSAAVGMTASMEYFIEQHYRIHLPPKSQMRES